MANGGAVGQRADDYHQQEDAGDHEQEEERGRGVVDGVRRPSVRPSRGRRRLDRLAVHRRPVVVSPVGRRSQPAPCVRGRPVVDDFEVRRTFVVDRGGRVITHRTRVMLNELGLRPVC